MAPCQSGLLHTQVKAAYPALVHGHERRSITMWDIRPYLYPQRYPPFYIDWSFSYSHLKRARYRLEA